MIIGNSKVCVSNKPIIDITEINYVTEIRYDPIAMTHYIDIGISSGGMQTLSKTVASLPFTVFALVVNDGVVCVFEGSADFAISSIRIGEDAALKDLEIIHEALQGLNP